MPTQDRILLSLAGISGCVSVWLVFQSITQWTLRPMTSPSNIVFLVVVTGTIVVILLTKKPAVTPSVSGGARVNRAPLLIVGVLAAIVLAGSTIVSDQVKDPGAASIALPPEVSLAGFGGLGVLLILLRLRWLRVQRSQDAEQAPGPLRADNQSDESPAV